MTATLPGTPPSATPARPTLARLLLRSHLLAAAAGFGAAVLVWAGLSRLGLSGMVALVAGMVAAGGLGYLFSRQALASVHRAIEGLAEFVDALKVGRRQEVLLVQPAELTPLAEKLRSLSDSFASALAETSRRQWELSAVLSSLVDGCIAVDPEQHIILFNRAAESMFGVRVGEVLGRNVVEAIRSYDLVTAFRETLSTGRQDIREFRPAGVTPGGEGRVLQVSVTPLHAPAPPGGPARGTWGAVALVRDVTELRRLERVRTDFVANVSHELRTPLTAIKGFIEALQEGAVDDPATRARFLEIMAKETDRLVALISDLLELSHLESRTGEFEPRPVRLAEVADAVLVLFRSKAQTKGLQLITEIPGELPSVLADEHMLRQVFINLLDNAVKYTPAGEIRVRARGEPRSGRVMVEVSDTGIGIPRQHQARIFERFYRVDRARSRELGGTGLGLSIVRHIVERHGGRIEVESEVGEGSTFRFWLPMAPVEQSSAQAPSPAAPQG